MKLRHLCWRPGTGIVRWDDGQGHDTFCGIKWLEVSGDANRACSHCELILSFMLANKYGRLAGVDPSKVGAAVLQIPIAHLVERYADKLMYELFKPHTPMKLRKKLDEVK